ncbi:MAG: endonuclease MutS2, partial [Clostridia bacterium]|nr:endonuclease MutS2 [Clostridia bacterium]
MYNIERYSKTLELDKILQSLSNEASIAETKAEALKLLPQTDFNTVGFLLSQTDSAYTFMAQYLAPNFAGARNVISALNRAVAGAVLSMRD